MGNQNMPTQPMPQGRGNGQWHYSPGLTAITVLAILALVVTGLYYTLKQPLKLGPVTFTPKSAATQTTLIPESTENNKYTINKIEDLNITFKISEYPDTTFTLTKVVKVGGLKPEGCNDANIPAEVRKEIKLSNGCYGETPEAGKEYTLVGINLSISNNSNKLIKGDNVVNLVYYNGNESEDVMRFARRDIGFGSYSVSAYDDKEIGLSYWIPTDPTAVYLAYGPTTLPNRILPFGQKLMQNYEGALKIDFTSSQVTSSKQ